MRMRSKHSSLPGISIIKIWRLNLESMFLSEGGYDDPMSNTLNSVGSIRRKTFVDEERVEIIFIDEGVSKVFFCNSLPASAVLPL